MYTGVAQSNTYAIMYIHLN